MRLLPVLLGQPPGDPTGVLDSLSKSLSQITENLQGVKARIVSQEADRQTRIREEHEIRLARTIAYVRRRSLEEINECLHQYVVAHIKISGQRSVPRELKRITDDLAACAEGVPDDLVFISARRLAGLDVKVAKELACKRLWRTSRRIPLTHRIPF